MATVSIIRGRGEGSGRVGTPSLYVAGSTDARQVLTSSASNQVSTVTGVSGATVVISVDGGAIKLAMAIGSNPDATSAYDIIVADGSILPLLCKSGDERFAIVDV